MSDSAPSFKAIGLTSGKSRKPLQQYGKKRRCACGAELSRYNASKQCSACKRDPNRAIKYMQQFRRAK